MGRSYPARAKHRFVALERGVSLRGEASPNAIHAPDYSTRLLSAAVSRHTFGTYMGHGIQLYRCALRAPVRACDGAYGNLAAGAWVTRRVEIGG